MQQDHLGDSGSVVECPPLSWLAVQSTATE